VHFQRLFQGFSLAVSMLSILPFFNVHHFFKGINGYAVMVYPLVGLLLGTLLGGTYLLLHPYFPQEHLKVALMFLWVLLTGALHLDGFADTVDALFVSPSAAQAVMKEPHVGAMALVFTTAFLIFKASALWHLEVVYLLPILMMLARYNTVLAIYFFPYIRQEGMGKLAKEELSTLQLVSSSLLVMSVLFIWPKGWLLLGVSLFVLFITKHFFLRRYGGFSGDMYGFLIEISELAMLNALLVGTQP